MAGNLQRPSSNRPNYTFTNNGYVLRAMKVVQTPMLEMGDEVMIVKYSAYNQKLTRKHIRHEYNFKSQVLCAAIHMLQKQHERPHTSKKLVINLKTSE